MCNRPKFSIYLTFYFWEIKILGDFNFPVLSWKTAPSLNTPSPSASELLEFTEEKNLFTQLVKEPTRGDNTLDLILTNTPRYVMEYE